MNLMEKIGITMSFILIATMVFAIFYDDGGDLR